ncbi:MAG TPA: hypothetical protein VKK79_11930, partial [Candidatus Lokiarchaeia archaeon]|nr:hypothetical protein [Candidatus Lokiarchaeia archaeon]
MPISGTPHLPPGPLRRINRRRCLLRSQYYYSTGMRGSLSCPLLSGAATHSYFLAITFLITFY